MTIEKVSPPAAPKPIGHYSHVAIVPPNHRLLVFAGQVGSLPDGSFPASVEGQFEQAMANALGLAALMGAGADDVVKLTYYLTERPADMGRVRAAIRSAFVGTPPAATYLLVSGLAQEQIKVEIELVAAVPA